MTMTVLCLCAMPSMMVVVDSSIEHTDERLRRLGGFRKRGPSKFKYRPMDERCQVPPATIARCFQFALAR
jgi:hypothetical protein